MKNVLVFQINPIFCKKDLQSRHGQFSGFHFFISDLNVSRLLAFFNLSGKMFQIVGPKYEMLSDP